MASKAATTALVQEHLRQKQQMIHAIHAAAIGHDLCGVFDQVLHDAGLHGRDRYYNGTDRERPVLVGEETEEAFEQWKLGVAASIHNWAAENSGLATWHQQLMDHVGLVGRPQPVRVLISGTFEFPHTVTQVPGGPLPALPWRTIRDAVYNSMADQSQAVKYEVKLPKEATATT